MEMGRSAPSPSRYVVAAVCTLLLLAVALVFGQAVTHEFTNFDDFDYVRDNPQVARGLTARGVVWAFTHFHCSNWHPLTWLSHMLDCQLYGLNHAGGHHLTNVLLHAASAVLLFLVLKQMTDDLWPSAFAAGLFAIHPLHVESVAWVAECKDMLSGLFFMLTLAAYAGYARRRFSIFRYLLVTASFALGLMAKPTLVTMPFVLLLLDYWPLRRIGATSPLSVRNASSPQQSPRSLPRVLLEKLPWLLLAAGSCLVTYSAQQTAIIPFQRFSFASRIANALVSYVAYLCQFFYPAALAVYYPRPQDGLPIWKIAASLFVLFGISLAVLSCRKRPYLLVGWLWYLGMLVPTIGLVQVGVQAMADRYTYLTQIGLSIALGWEAARVCRHWPSCRRVVAVTSVLAIMSLGSCAWQQVSYWKDSEALWPRTLACTSRNVLALNCYGLALADRGKLDKAITQYRAALDIEPGFVEAHINLAHALAGRGRVNEAIAQYRKALEVRPDSPEAHDNLGSELARRGKLDEAIVQFQKALEIRPDYAEAHNNLGNALLYSGDVDGAIAQYRKALATDGDFALAHNNLGSALASRGKYDEAIAHFQAALEIKPDLAGVDVRRNIELALSKRAEPLTALAQRRELLRSRPKDVTLLNDTAWLLATAPNATARNGPEAVQLAQLASKISNGKRPEILRTLAAAYAETGQFSEALEAARKALDLARQQNKLGLAKSIQAEIRLYEAGTSFHE